MFFGHIPSGRYVRRLAVRSASPQSYESVSCVATYYQRLCKKSVILRFKYRSNNNMQKKQLRVLFLLANIVSLFMIFILHQGKSGAQGVEAIKDLSFYIFIPSIVLLFSIFINYPNRKEWLHFMGLLSLSLILYITATHSGARDGVSIFDHPIYVVNLLSAIGMIALRDID